MESEKVKDKIIEEMAKTMCNGCIENELMTCTVTHEEVPCCFAKQFAEALYNAGYRKIPEGVVVLTEGEYSDMLSAEVETIERDIAEYWANEDAESVAKELHKDGYRKLDDHAILVLRKAKGLEEKVRKETAEKFAERLKERLDISVNGYSTSEVMSEIEDKIDEIAKEITEGDNG